MPEQEITMPKFSSESEEADWWASNPDFVLQELKRAKAEGRLGHGSMMRQMAAKSTTIRLSTGDIARARALAERKGLRYQTYLKMLIHEALDSEAKAAQQKDERRSA